MSRQRAPCRHVFRYAHPCSYPGCGLAVMLRAKSPDPSRVLCPEHRATQIAASIRRAQEKRLAKDRTAELAKRAMCQKRIKKYGAVRDLSRHIGDFLRDAAGAIYQVASAGALITYRDREPEIITSPSVEMLRGMHVTRLSCHEVSEKWGVRI